MSFSLRNVCRVLLFGVLPLLHQAAAASAECPTLNFEDRAVGTVITSQYDGVTFSAPAANTSCTGDALIVSAAGIGGTSSGTRALGTQAGGSCEFAPQYLRMVFDQAQSEVTFTMGPGCGTYVVRAYSTTSGSTGLISSRSYTITDCTVWHGVYYFVRVTASGNLRRIEIDAGEAVAETIDDLTFDVDTTPPTVYISSPAPDACACSTVAVYGVTCDADGDYGSDRAEYLRFDAAPGTAWTLIDDATFPVCSEGVLYYWDVSALASGRYYLRITTTNACGLVSTAITTVYVDRAFDTLSVRYPASGAFVGGQVCIDGTAWDWLCFDYYTVLYRPASGGTWTPVDPAHPTYTSTVATDPVASWNTAPLSGAFDLRVTGHDACGNTAAVTRSVIVDNKPPAAAITSPAYCAFLSGSVDVRGTADDANIDEWILDYTGGASHGWTEIARGNAGVSNATLGTWNVSGLQRCGYTLRLRVYDKTVLNCGSPLRQMTEHTRTVMVGDTCDVNGDGLVDGTDIAPFVQCLLGG